MTSRDIAGEHWYQVVKLTPVGKDNQHENAVHRQNFDRDGRPAYFPERSNAVPLKLNLNRIPRDRRHARNADTLIGRFWDVDGLWVVLARPAPKSEKVYLPAPSCRPRSRSTEVLTARSASIGRRPGQGKRRLRWWNFRKVERLSCQGRRFWALPFLRRGPGSILLRLRLRRTEPLRVSALRVTIPSADSSKGRHRQVNFDSILRTAYGTDTCSD